MKQLTEQLARAIVRPRSRNTYKGSFGKILIIGGNAQYGGAAIMSASAAVYAGAGLVSVRPILSIAALYTPAYLKR